MAYTTINKPSEHFNTKIFTGNGSLPRAITGVGHQPDFVWLKDRETAYNHQLYDSVRGTSAGVLYSNATDAQDNTYQMSSFDSDGYTMGSNLGAVNSNGKDIVSWNWKAGGGQGSSNTDGSINTTYTSANTTAGFSISTYTGTGANATVGHGLGVAPNMVLVKSLSGGGDWTSYHSVLGNTKFMRLNSTNAVATQSSYWNNTSPTSTVFSLGSAGDTNTNGGTHVAYCFAEKQGYSKFGSYVGNANADGTFVYTGFKPAFVMYKKAIQTGGQSGRWVIIDNKRDIDNVASHGIFPHSSGTEDTGSQYWDIDMLSNGFKLKTTEQETNGSSETFIYMAFAESPLVSSNNIPCTAR